MEGDRLEPHPPRNASTGYPLRLLFSRSSSRQRKKERKKEERKQKGRKERKKERRNKKLESNPKEHIIFFFASFADILLQLLCFPFRSILQFEHMSSGVYYLFRNI